jgi:hypothetical protein
MPRTVASAPITVGAASTAVALLTRQAFTPEVPREGLLDGQDPAAVLEVMEIIAGALLNQFTHGDSGAQVLQHIGLSVEAGP